MKYHSNTNWNKQLKDFTPETRGAWDSNSKNSDYHFDSSIKDKPGDYFKVLGYFDLSHREVQTEIDWIISRADWEQGKGSREYDDLSDSARNLHGFSEKILNKTSSGSIKGFQSTLHEKMFPLLSKLKQASGLEFYSSKVTHDKIVPHSARIICQSPGHMFQLHVDNELWRIHHDPSQVVRMVVMLDDWKAGQLYQYGTCLYEGWKRGEVHVFDWPNVPHSTANTSKVHRPSLQFTALKTPVYEELLKHGNRDTEINWDKPVDNN
jgi:hypothetical protein